MKPLLFLFTIIFNNAHASNDNLEIKLCYEDVVVYPWITGDLKGLVIQELQQVEKITNIKFKFIRLPWKRCQIEAQNGKLDGLIAASFTKERAQWGVYPTHKNGDLNRNQRLHTDSFMVFKTKHSPIRFEGGKFINLGTNKIGVQLGYSVGTDLVEQGYPTHSSFSTAYDLIQALDSNSINVAVLQTYPTLKALHDNPKLKNNIVGLNPPFKVADQYLLFTKKVFFWPFENILM
jgi:polar amino acid transport system substrate-binding protein